MNQQETERTKWHRWAERRISDLGIQYRSEVSFPPYQVDIYIPDCHVAIEIDGPHHLVKRDEKRDAVLFSQYQLQVIRFDSRRGLHADDFIERLISFLEWHGQTAAERRRDARQRTN